MSEPASTTSRDIHRQILLLSTAAFASSATMRVADPLLPELSMEFSVTAGEAGIIVTAFAFAYGLCQLFYGPLGDRFGKFTIVFAATLFSAFTVGSAAASHSLEMLGLLRLIAGAGAAAIIPLSMAYIGDTVPYGERQALLARFMSGQILGIIFGQAFGGIFAQLLGWRGLFVVLGACYLVVALLLWRELRSPRVRERRSDRIDFLALPGRYLSLFKSATVRLVVSTVCIEGFLSFGSIAYLGAYLHDRYGLSLGVIGLVIACFGLGGLLYVLVARRLVARLGERRMALSGGLLMAVGLGGSVLVADWRIVPLFTTTLGLGFYLLHNTLQTNATQMAPHARGMAMSVFASVLFIGTALGAAVFGGIIDWIGYRPVFLGCGAGLAVLAASFAHHLGRRTEALA